MAKAQFRPYNITIPAGGYELNAKGRYFRVHAASETLLITGTDGQKDEMLDASTGGIPAGIELGPFDPQFQKLLILTASGNPGTATIFVSDVPTNVSTVAGTVNIIDQNSGENEAAVGSSFKAFCRDGGGAGNKTFVKIRNPVGSGVRVILKRMRAYSVSGASNLLWLTSVDVTDYTAAANTINALIGGSGGAPKGVMTHGNNVAGGDAVMSNEFDRDIIVANTEAVVIERDYEIILMPGNAMVLQTGAQADLNVSLEWVEKV